ncbi:MAG TPA: hypothetical protein VIR30_13175 [Nocardioides sp.]
MRAHLALAAFVVSALLTGCSSGMLGEEGRDARIGEIFDANGRAEGYPVLVNLPKDRFQFTVSAPKAEASESLPLANQDVSEEAADGTAFLALSMERQQVPGDVWMLGEGSEEPSFTMDVDGRTYDLDLTEQRSWILVIPEDPDEVRLVAEVDGREFPVDPYDEIRTDHEGDVYRGEIPILNDLECLEATETNVNEQVAFSGVDCRVSALGPVPWVGLPDAGPWPDPGDRFLVIRTIVPSGGHFRARDGAEWSESTIKEGEPTFTIDGKEPVAVLTWEGERLTAENDDGPGRRLVFEVSDREAVTFVISRRFDATGRDGSSVSHLFKQAMEIELR